MSVYGGRTRMSMFMHRVAFEQFEKRRYFYSDLSRRDRSSSGPKGKYWQSWRITLFASDYFLIASGFATQRSCRTVLPFSLFFLRICTRLARRAFIFCTHSFISVLFLPESVEHDTHSRGERETIRTGYNFGTQR